MDTKIVKEYASIGDIDRLGKLGYTFLFENGMITRIYDREGKEI